MHTLFPVPSPYDLPKLKLLPLRDQPAYRVAHNAAACSLVELLAAVVGGTQQIEVAEALLARFGDLRRLYQAHLSEIAQVRGVGQQTAVRIKAALALGQKLLDPETERPAIHSPADAAALVQHEMSLLEQEYLKVILLDTRNRLMDIVEVYHGSLNSSQVRVGELFKPAITRMAAAMIICHNHPSGDPTPSPDDVAVTRAIIQAGKLVDVDILDHLVIGQAGRWVSLKERGLGFESGRVSEKRTAYRINENPRACSAYPFPHRMSDGKCRGPEVCHHRRSLPNHPDYVPAVDGCSECEFWEHACYYTDLAHDWVLLQACETPQIIYAYTRAMALDDGVLVDVSQMAWEAGFRWPTAITADLHARLQPGEDELSRGQSYEGRLWDLLWMARCAVRSEVHKTVDQVAYEMIIADYDPHSHGLVHTTLHLWMAVGPGDNGEQSTFAQPVITIGFPTDF